MVTAASSVCLRLRLCSPGQVFTVAVVSEAIVIQGSPQGTLSLAVGSPTSHADSRPPARVPDPEEGVVGCRCTDVVGR